jgi:hypothetical protein
MRHGVRKRNNSSKVDFYSLDNLLLSLRAIPFDRDSQEKALSHRAEYNDIRRFTVAVPPHAASGSDLLAFNRDIGCHRRLHPARHRFGGFGN